MILADLQYYTLVTGSGEGNTALSAFDKALLASGVGNTNLIKLSSILPPGLQEKSREELVLRPGALVPIAFGSICSQNPGETISAGVAIGMIPGTYGVIMEASGQVTGSELECRLRRMVTEALSNRGTPVTTMKVAVAEHTATSLGCAFAGVVLWG